MWGNIKIYLFRFGQSLPLTKTIVTLKCMSSFLGVPVWMIWVCNTSTLLWHKGLPLAQHVKKQINSKSQTLVPRLDKSLNCIAKLYSVTGIMFTECLQPRSSQPSPHKEHPGTTLTNWKQNPANEALLTSQIRKVCMSLSQICPKLLIYLT